jgi:hypothetical protein
MESNIEKIDTLFNATTLEGIFANLRQDGSEWSRQQLDILNKMVFYRRSKVQSLWVRSATALRAI